LINTGICTINSIWSIITMNYLIILNIQLSTNMFLGVLLNVAVVFGKANP
jgi:hypothetical protein